VNKTKRIKEIKIFLQIVFAVLIAFACAAPQKSPDADATILSQNSNQEADGSYSYE
jgi:hypothetical protein